MQQVSTSISTVFKLNIIPGAFKRNMGPFTSLNIFLISILNELGFINLIECPRNGTAPLGVGISEKGLGALSAEYGLKLDTDCQLLFLPK